MQKVWSVATYIVYNYGSSQILISGGETLKGGKCATFRYSYRLPTASNKTLKKRKIFAKTFTKPHDWAMFTRKQHDWGI